MDNDAAQPELEVIQRFGLGRLVKQVGQTEADHVHGVRDQEQRVQQTEHILAPKIKHARGNAVSAIASLDDHVRQLTCVVLSHSDRSRPWLVVDTLTGRWR